MNRRVQDFANRWWDGQFGVAGTFLTLLLTPMSWLWGAVVRSKARRYTGGGRVRVDELTVVSVGNLAVGGTGKTPVSSWVASVLADSGAKPALLLNGYGRDEELLHRAWTPDLTIESGRDRIVAARRARDAGCDVAVLDDGYQHQRLDRALNILLMSAEDRFPGRLLPCGPYREGPPALDRTDVLVVTRRIAPEDVSRGQVDIVRSFPGVAEDLVAGGVWLAPGDVVQLTPDWGPVSGRGACARALSDLEDPVVLTAIARPRPLVAQVMAACGGADLIAFGDHHEFTREDAEKARRRAKLRPLLVTEKDAVKLQPFADVLTHTWVLSQRIVWDWGEQDVRDAILTVAGR
ncbi:MAG: tetraacyldisaccharide 4'-kinase [Longimicrobiales bacterium]